MLKNENNILPLNKDIKTIAVIGPNANVKRNLLGDYTYPAHIEVMIKMAEDMGVQMSLLDEPAETVSEFKFYRKSCHSGRQTLKHLSLITGLGA